MLNTLFFKVGYLNKMRYRFTFFNLRDSEDETVKIKQESEDVIGGTQESFLNRSQSSDSQGQIEQIGFMPPLQNSGQPSSVNYDPMTSVKIESMSS